LKEEHTLREFENRVPRKIFVAKRGESKRRLGNFA
jgi:hypothetical protein